MRFARPFGPPLILALAAAGCSTGTASVQTETSRDDLISRRGEFQARVLLTGELEAVRAQKILVPRTPTWQLPIRWLADDGIVVAKGQKVLELDNTQFTGDIEQKRLAESGAYNDLARKRADVRVSTADKQFALEQARIAMEKATIEAAIPENLRAKRDYQEDQLDLARARSSFDKATEDLETTRLAAEAELRELEIALERTLEAIRSAEQAIDALVLEAPRDGLLVVAENRNEGRKFQVGDNVWVGLEVMRIPDLNQMKVVADLSDVDDGRIAPGMRVECALDIYPETTYTGFVVEIAPIAQEESDQSMRRAFHVEIALEDTDAERMRPGMSVRVEVLTPPRADVVIVPRAALDFTVDPPRVLLAGGSSSEVTLGPCSVSECVVEDGLDAGVHLRARS